MLANRGFVAVAIDGRYHGEREGEGRGLSTPYTTAIFNAYKTGREHPFFYDTVLDVMRLIDYLETRPDVDASRIGLGGGSKGGIETYLTAAVDPRIAAAVAERAVQSFNWALDHGAWDSRAWTFRDALEAAAAEAKAPVNASFVRQFYDRVAPGIYGKFDAPAMLPLAAPRAMLVINGDSDPRTPIAGVRESAAAAERAYQRGRREREIRASSDAEPRPREHAGDRSGYGRVVRAVVETLTRRVRVEESGSRRVQESKSPDRRVEPSI